MNCLSLRQYRQLRVGLRNLRGQRVEYRMCAQTPWSNSPLLRFAAVISCFFAWFLAIPLFWRRLFMLVLNMSTCVCALLQIDATPFRQWYEHHYGVALGKKKKDEAEKKVKQSVQKKHEERRKERPLDAHVKDQFNRRFVLCFATCVCACCFCSDCLARCCVSRSLSACLSHSFVTCCPYTRYAGSLHFSVYSRRVVCSRAFPRPPKPGRPII